MRRRNPFQIKRLWKLQNPSGFYSGLPTGSIRILDCWLQPFRKGGTPRRTTLCEARKRLGIAPMRLLAEQVIQLQGEPTTPGAFYRGMRTMALDGFVVDVADSSANVRAFGRPGSGRAP